MLLQSATSVITGVITKCGGLFYYKVRWSVITRCDSLFYYKLRHALLQSATILLQSAIGIIRLKSTLGNSVTKQKSVPVTSRAD